MYDAEIVEQPARRVAAVPHKGPYTQIDGAFGRCSALMEERGLTGDIRQMIGIYHDDPGDVAEENLNSHAGFVVTGDTPIAPPLEEVVLGADRCVVLRVSGPYTGLAAAYRYLFERWMPQAKERSSDAPAYEIYLNSPADTAEDDLLTDIVVPLIGEGVQPD